jgi:hypothetical protein
MVDDQRAQESLRCIPVSKTRMDEYILAAARESHELERLEDIKYTVLGTTGCISIIRKPSAK